MKLSQMRVMVLLALLEEAEAGRGVSGSSDRSAGTGVSGGGDDACDVRILLTTEVRWQLSQYPDQWDSHRRLVGLVLEAEKERAASSSSSSSTGIASHQAHLQEVSASLPYLRGPRLAEIELLLLFWQGRGLGKGQQVPPGWRAAVMPAGLGIGLGVGAGAGSVERELTALLGGYVESFQSKQCCYGDLRGFLAVLAGGGGEEGGRAVLGELARWAQLCAAAIEGKLSVTAPPPPPAAARGKKKKPKEGSGGAGGDDGASSKAAMAGREEVVEQLCAASKLRQIATHCAHLLHCARQGSYPRTPASTPPSSLVLALAPIPHLPEGLFPAEAGAVSVYLSTKRLCAGGVGGDKEVC